ncbi:carbohydrate ABC transporter permease [Clostridium sp.]|uniref:carbohydrate ABC transporter permease n=1 Tax=Clostridium sp. TaxID=1506 RepID=UPI0026271825|nr:sugar ABC transporter permease [uncultured Clostridium sp.]
MSKIKLTSKRKWGILFVSPWVIYFFVFLAYPMALAFKNSYLSINLIQPERATFVGFENWINVATDGLFWKSMFNILFNQSIFIALTFIISLSLALILTKIKLGGSLFRTIYFIPMVTSVVIAMLIFNYISSPTGPIQQLMLQHGWIREGVFWKTTKWLPMPIIAIFSSWKWFGIQMIIFIGGLAGIDKQVIEAAQIDGSSWINTLFAITIPLLKPQIIFVMTMNIINGFQMFTEVFINFDLLGGPYNSALTPVMYLYQKGFQDMQMGEASAIGILLAIVIFIFTKIQNKVLNVIEE